MLSIRQLTRSFMQPGCELLQDWGHACPRLFLIVTCAPLMLNDAW